MHVEGEVDDVKEETEHPGVENVIRDSYGSWSLLLQVFWALIEFWAALAFMYWSLLHKEEEMMNCSAYDYSRMHSFFVRHVCSYTLACLRGFPILAANMVLVLMMRILLQTRIYYSMLELKFVVDFADSPVMHTLWPLACGISMFQGGFHFILKAYYMPEEVVSNMFFRLVRKFVLPGTIFFSILWLYADIENTLVPLNRIVEQDYTDTQRHCPWLGKLQAMNERVLAFDARHRDVVGAAQKSLGHSPTIRDIMLNIIEHYEDARVIWGRLNHRHWGLFRSMWPASVLVDRRLDRNDPETKAWISVYTILATLCSLASLLSMYILSAYGGCIDMMRMVFAGQFSLIKTETIMANFVLVSHGLLIVVFVYRTVLNMFCRSVRSMLHSKT